MSSRIVVTRQCRCDGYLNSYEPAGYTHHFCFAMNRPVAQPCHMCGIELTGQARNYREIWKKAVGSNPDYMIGLLTEIKNEMAQGKQDGGSCQQ